MKITEVRVKMVHEDSERLRAFCSVTLDDSFVIRDLKIIDGDEGPFVAMPSRKMADRCAKCGEKNHLRAKFCNECGTRLNPNRAPRDSDGRVKLYADIAHPINVECREQLQEAVAMAYQEELQRIEAAPDDLGVDESGTDDDASDDTSFGYEALIDELRGKAPTRRHDSTTREAPSQPAAARQADPIESKQSPTDRISRNDSRRTAPAGASIVPDYPTTQTVRETAKIESPDDFAAGLELYDDAGRKPRRVSQNAEPRPGKPSAPQAASDSSPSPSKSNSDSHSRTQAEDQNRHDESDNGFAAGIL